MRRLYDSDVYDRDRDYFSRSERETDERRRGRPAPPPSKLRRLLVPNWVRNRAISIRVSTPESEFPVGTPIPFTITMRNALPVSVTVRTASPLLWTWYVDGVQEASRVSLRDPPAEPHGFAFARGERKRFRKRWDQHFRTSRSEWKPAAPGEYTIGVGLNVERASEKGLWAETTVRVVPE